MTTKIKVGSRISVEVYECTDNNNSDLYDYCGDVEGVVVAIYESDTIHTQNRIKLNESDTLEGITLIANFDGDYQEVEEDCYEILEV